MHFAKKIFGIIDSPQKIQILANQIQTILAGRLKCDYKEIYTDSSQFGRSGHANLI